MAWTAWLSLFLFTRTHARGGYVELRRAVASTGSAGDTGRQPLVGSVTALFPLELEGDQGTNRLLSTRRF